MTEPQQDPPTAAPWHAEVSLEPELLLGRIRAECPQLEIHSCEPFGSGWDNTALLINKQLVFRFPRRQLAEALMRTECEVLPQIANALPVPIPNPVFQGEPDPNPGGYPYPFAGYRLIPGESAGDLDLSASDRAQLAEDIGTFLGSLHSLPRPSMQGGQVELAADEMDRLGFSKRIPQAQGRLQKLRATQLLQRASTSFEEVQARLDELPQHLATPSTCLVHGDFYSRHLMVQRAEASEARAPGVGDSCKLSGVIDWGDVHWGHPSEDLGALFGFLPPRAASSDEACLRQQCLHAYNRAANTQLQLSSTTQQAVQDWECLARFKALYHSLALTDYAHSVDDQAVLREALRALRWALD